MGRHVAELVEPEALPVVEERRRPLVARLLAWLALAPLLLLGAAALTGTALYLTDHLRVATVISGSMEPGIPTGSLVLGWASEPKVDAVVMGTRGDGSFVTHRVIELLPDGSFRMQGDANASPDAQAYDGDSWTVFLHLPYVGKAVRWAVEEPLALVGVGTLAGVILAGAMRPDCRKCRTSQERLTNG